MSDKAAPPEESTSSPTHLLHDRLIMRAFLENVPDFVHFKDAAGRFIAASKSKIRRNGLIHEDDILGRTDFDFFSERNARLAKEDDDRVMKSGVPVLRKLEKVDWTDGRTTWAIINKMPLRDETGEIMGTFGLTSDVTESKQIELALEKTHRDLVETSRMAGMAEVATGVIHNVGNVLNSLNIAAGMIVTGLRDSKVINIRKLCDLLAEHADDPHFLTDNPRGRRVPQFLESLAAYLIADRDRLLAETATLLRNIEHIQEIISAQQAYATMAGLIEPLDPIELMEHALRMNESALARHAVATMRDFQPTGRIIAERAKVLQILVNLITNAKCAAEDGGREDKCITLKIRPGDAGRILLIVSDNGIGVPAESMSRIFEHGFTTRRGGHGFGLHSSARAATDMKGSLTVQSDGPARGATFTLDLPECTTAVV